MSISAALQTGRVMTHLPDASASAARRNAESLHLSVEQAQGLRHSGSLTTRQIVAERIRDQLVIKRQLRERWLRDHLVSGQGATASSSSGAHDPAMVGTQVHNLGNPDTQPLSFSTATSGSVLQQLVGQYRQFFTRQGLRLGVMPGLQGAFGTRRACAERLLSRYFDLSGDELSALTKGLADSLPAGTAQPRVGEDGGQSGGGQSGGGQDGGQHGGAGGGHSGGQAGGQEQGQDANPSPALALRDYLVAEMALSDPGFSPETRVRLAEYQGRCFASESAAIQAAESLGRMTLDRVEQDGRLPASPHVGNARQAAVRTHSLHDMCASLLRLYPAETFSRAIASLISSVDVLGNRKAFYGDGAALSDCLVRIRNLSIIQLIMEKTEQLKNHMLFSLNTGRLPPDEVIWRAICKTTQGRSVEPILTALQDGDLSPSSARLLIQGLLGVLRELPIAVWIDPDVRGLILATMAESAIAIGGQVRVARQ